MIRLNPIVLRATVSCRTAGPFFVPLFCAAVICSNNAAGVGFRYRLPVVSLGVDVAKPLSTSGGVRLHLNITPKL